MKNTVEVQKIGREAHPLTAPRMMSALQGLTERTNRNLSLETRIPEVRLSQIKRGRVSPTTAEAAAIAKALGVNDVGIVFCRDAAKVEKMISALIDGVSERTRNSVVAEIFGAL